MYVQTCIISNKKRVFKKKTYIYLLEYFFSINTMMYIKQSYVSAPTKIVNIIIRFIINFFIISINELLLLINNVRYNI